jgi:hypothetical protein
MGNCRFNGQAQQSDSGVTSTVIDDDVLEKVTRGAQHPVVRGAARLTAELPEQGRGVCRSGD